MARTIGLDALANDPRKALARSLQSGHINFLIGSGASLPAIEAAGALERKVAELLDAGKAAEGQVAMYTFLSKLQEPTNKLIKDTDDERNGETLKRYEDFLRVLEAILSERRTTLLPKQATIFTTNY